MKRPETETSLIYMHSERGFYDEDSGALYLTSGNLIDFFLVVFGEVVDSVLIIPTMAERKGEIVLKLGQDTRVFAVSFPEADTTPGQKVKAGMSFFRTLTSKAVLDEIGRATYSVSIGLSFSGTIFGVIRTLVKKKKHSFIVRGNRFRTVRQSSRSLLSKYFALARVYLYNLVMVQLLKKGRAEIWFQGEERYRAYRDRLSEDAGRRLFLLNAVLRDLPKLEGDNAAVKKDELIFVGRINKEKGVFDLIEAISILSAEGHTVKATFIGEGRDQTEASEYAKCRLPAQQVEFSGYVSSPQELATLITRALVFVLPSYTEGLPRAMVESMWLGIPVLVTPVGGVKYVIRDGINGFLVEPRSPRKLAHKIKEILRLVDSNQTGDLIANARRDAMSYSFQHRARYFLKHSINSPRDYS